MKTKVITITEEQAEWLDENYVKLSALVQGMIEKEMEKRRDRDADRRD